MFILLFHKTLRLVRVKKILLAYFSVRRNSVVWLLDKIIIRAVKKWRSYTFLLPRAIRDTLARSLMSAAREILKSRRHE